MKDLIKKILKEETENKFDLIVPYRIGERKERYKRIIYKKIQDYIKNGSYGALFLTNSTITGLPNNLKSVGGTLDLYGSNIEKLPENLTVGNNLHLSDSSIKNLPSDLTVKHDIFANRTEISEIPDRLNIWGNLYIIDTPLSKKYSNSDVTKMIKNKGGHIKGIVVSKK